MHARVQPTAYAALLIKTGLRNSASEASPVTRICRECTQVRTLTGSRTIAKRWLCRDCAPAREPA